MAKIPDAGSNRSPGPTYQRRGGPVDFEIDKAGQAPNRACGNEAADVDYFGNLRKFTRHDNEAAEPIRGKQNESQQKPWGGK